MHELSLRTDSDQVARLHGTVGQLVAEANQVAVFDDNSLAAAIDLCGRIKALDNASEKERKALVQTPAQDMNDDKRAQIEALDQELRRWQSLIPVIKQKGAAAIEAKYDGIALVTNSMYFVPVGSSGLGRVNSSM